MTPSRTIVFHQAGSACDGSTPRSKPLGGTESAMIFMAEALARAGDRVYVFCNVDSPGMHDGVAYRDLSEFESFTARNSFDVFICIRSLLPLLIKRWAPLQIYFTPDAHDQPFVNRAFQVRVGQEGDQFDVGLYSLREVQKRVDAIFCVGHWQAASMADRFRIPKSKIHVVHNGVTDDFGPGEKLSVRGKSLVYASTPFRGLEQLLTYFPEIRARVPDATLYVVSGMQIYGQSDEEDRKAYGALYELGKQEGVTLSGPVAKLKLASILGRSRVMAYPNTFAETFCIAALEAQACGVPVVSTDLAAMKERISDGSDGFLVRGHPREAQYGPVFVERVTRLLTDDDLWHQMSERSREKSRAFSYDSLAVQWRELFDRIPAVGSASAEILRPSDSVAELLVRGYPRRLKLSASLVTQVMAQEMMRSGFPYCAGQLLKMDLKSPNYANPG